MRLTDFRRAPVIAAIDRRNDLRGCRVVGHSSFLSVLSAEGPCRAELLKLLVLVVSARGVISRAKPGGEGGSDAVAQGVGSALVRPLLAVYRASLSEEDQVRMFGGLFWLVDLIGRLSD